MNTITVEQLGTKLETLPENPRIVVSGNMAVPLKALEVVDKHLEKYTLNILNCPPGIPEREGVTAETSFVGGGMRKHQGLSYVPCRLSMVPMLYSQTLLPDAVIIHCAPPIDGQLSMGIEVNILPGAIDACRVRGGMIIAVINKNMPYTYGDGQIPVEHVDIAVEMDEPIVSAEPRVPDEESAKIGELVASMVADGSTLQMGIGAVPDATLAALTHHKNLRIWTEMFSDGVLALDEKGCMDKDHPLITSFLFGSDRLYSWLDKNPRVRMLRTEKTNDPSMIALQRKMVSVNTALQIDLLGQANASRIKGRIYSGFGGQTDFIVGALHCPGGQSFMALKSWHAKANVSTIVPKCQEPVTSFQQSAVVTEQGIAHLWGRSEREQAHELIENAAHPDAREELREAAKSMGHLYDGTLPPKSPLA